MNGNQLEFDKDEQEIRFVAWENGALNISMNCVYGGNADIELSREDVDELIELINNKR